MQITLIYPYPYSEQEILAVLYTAYRICYSKKSTSEILQDIRSGKISEDQIKNFIKERFKTGHTSPLRQIHFTFIAEGVSRVLTAQFNRHVVGVDRCEMSQRYIDLSNNEIIIPKALESYDVKENEGHPADFLLDWHNDNLDKYCVLKRRWNINKEDARYGLSIGSVSREQFTMSFEALQNFLDVRLCSCAQDEIREMAWKMYKIMRKRFPFLSSALGIKCWSNRLGYCDENEKQYQNCKWGKKRPSKDILMKLWREYK